VGGGYLDGPTLETFTGWAALSYDHGYDGEVFYLGLALAPKDIEGFVALCGTAAVETADQADHHPY
jgi:hypothetical protein